jgi:hypothetical protein
LFSQSYNQWVSTVAHVCRNKLKVRQCISVLFHSLRPWGEWGRARGRVRRPQPVFLSTLFSARRAIRLRRGGTQAHINPLPSGCNHHRDAHYALSIIYSIKSPTQQFLRAFRAKDKRSDEGEGGNGVNNPLPPGCDHHRNAHHARSSTLNIYISFRSPILAASPQPRPPPTRASHSPPTFLCSVIYIV